MVENSAYSTGFETIKVKVGNHQFGSYKYKTAEAREKAIQKALEKVLSLMGSDINPWDCIIDSAVKEN